MVAAMDSVGVDGVIFISSFSMYQYDASCDIEVRNIDVASLNYFTMSALGTCCFRK